MNSYVNMGVGALLGTVFVLMSVSIASKSIFHSEVPEQHGYAIEVAETGSDAAGGAATEVVSVATLLASADPAKGETVFKKCVACHTAESGGANKVGPNLFDLVNRPIASHEGFSYSAGMKDFSKDGSEKWDFDHLNQFLLGPKKFIAGTSMGFAGLKKDSERADLMAYLRTLSANPAELPSAEEAPAAVEATPAATEAPASQDEAPATEQPAQN